MEETTPLNSIDANGSGHQTGTMITEGKLAVIVRSPGRTPLHLGISEPLEIGRECTGLLLDDPLISRRHLELHLDGGRVMVSDLGTTNGSTINGRPLTTACALGVVDVVAFGDSSVQLSHGTTDNSRA